MNNSKTKMKINIIKAWLTKTINNYNVCLILFSLIIYTKKNKNLINTKSWNKVIINFSLLINSI
jgi:hypothetical protein